MFDEVTVGGKNSRAGRTTLEVQPPMAMLRIVGNATPNRSATTASNLATIPREAILLGEFGTLV
jgi:hypothetical protein